MRITKKLPQKTVFYVGLIKAMLSLKSERLGLKTVAILLQKRLAPLSSPISKAVGILDFQQMTVLTLFGFQSIGRKFQNMT